VEAVLLANAAATLFMVGLAWFVGVVHYPLFASVGERDFAAYHALHSRRTTWVVLPMMSVELLSSFALCLDPPGGEAALAIAGALLALGTWALTGAAAVPAHRRLGEGFSDAGLRSLRRADLARAVVWTAHGVVVIALLATQL